MSYNLQQKKPASRVHSLGGRSTPAESLFRPSPDPGAPQNESIMYDRRVVRANGSDQTTTQTSVVSHFAGKRRPQRSSVPVQTKDASVGTTHRPVVPPEQKTSEAQTDLNLGEYGVPIMATVPQVVTVTEVFLPPKTGRDIATQIQEGDLFDFDKEVPPLVEIMVDKVIEQSVLEVKEEDELDRLSAQQKAFQELRNTELAEVQRLKEQERRHREEKERRIAQQRVQEQEQEATEREATQTCSKEHLASMFPAIFATTKDQDPVEKEIEANFLPWLMSKVDSNMEKRERTREVLDSIVKSVGQMRLDRYLNQSDRTCD